MNLKALSVISTLLLCGCASTTMQVGTPIDPAKVSQIQKGTTTKIQIEAMFGQSSSTALMGSGRHLTVYQNITSTGEAHVTAANFIPIVGGFVPVHGTGSSHVQQLQIIYTDKDVVEDYSYSDNATQTTTTVSPFGGMSMQTQGAPASSTASDAQ